MKKPACYFSLLLLFAGAACQEKHADTTTVPAKKILVSPDGLLITFPDTASVNYFKTQEVNTSNIQAQFFAPARVVATVVKSTENTDQNLVLFDNPDLTANYTAFLQHITNINTYNANLGRVKDLAANGASTGKEVIEATTALANERSAIIQDEAQLKLSGLDPKALIHARLNSVWMICDIPETQIDNLKLGTSCDVHFSSFPDEVFKGTVEDFGDVVDRVTRMVKLRISINNPKGVLKAGMFATVQFGIKEGRFIAVSRDALTIVQGKNYVFVKTGPLTYERREVATGDQIDNKIVIFSGLKENEAVASTHVMQLKGLSFGY